uniref:Transmembrane protein n=1 Tax=Romanomermis culicivorax TaxID=13658 RepID=A0A915J246_ROMCU
MKYKENYLLTVFLIKVVYMIMKIMNSACFSVSLSIIYLIFIQFTIFVFPFAFVLKSDDDETDENVHHEKSDNYDKSGKKYGDGYASVDHRTHVLFTGRVDSVVE